MEGSDIAPIGVQGVYQIPYERDGGRISGSMALQGVDVFGSVFWSESFRRFHATYLIDRSLQRTQEGGPQFGIIDARRGLTGGGDVVPRKIGGE